MTQEKKEFDQELYILKKKECELYIQRGKELIEDDNIITAIKYLQKASDIKKNYL